MNLVYYKYKGKKNWNKFIIDKNITQKNLLISPIQNLFRYY